MQAVAVPSYRSLLGSAFPDKRSSVFSALSALGARRVARCCAHATVASIQLPILAVTSSIPTSPFSFPAESIPGLVAPVLFTQLYSRTVSGFSGCAYVAMGLAAAAALALLLGFAAVDLVVDEASGRGGLLETREAEGTATTGHATRRREDLPFVVSS